MAISFATILRDLATSTPSAPALTCGETTWSFAELDARSSQVAQALLEAGVRGGDRVAMLSRNCAEFFELIFACNKIGAIFMALNWRLAPPEIEAIIADGTPHILIHGAMGESALLTDGARANPGLTRIIAIGADYDAWRTAQNATDPGHAGAEDDVALLLYTSGTTGLPKGAMLTNRGMAYTQRLGAEWGMDASSVNLVAMPMFHIGGCGYGSSTMLVGGHTVLMREVNLPDILDTIAKHRVTHAFFVPTVVQSLLQEQEASPRDLSSLRLLMYGAAPVSETLLRKALDLVSCEFMQAYGMTETSGTVVNLEPASHRLDGATAPRLRACGRALPFVDIRITDPQTGEAVRTGDVGEIWVRSEMVMLGYWNNPGATEDTIRPGGWLRTGDAAYQDDEGYIYLFDRFKDMIISGGENIYPAEIENVLLAHPAISEAAVIGIPHGRWGETPCAIVVLREGKTADAEELIAFTRGRLAHYKCPTSVIFADALPRNASGKILKRELRLHHKPAGTEAAGSSR